MPNDTVIGVFSESTDAAYDRDRWENGFYSFNPFFLVVKTDGMDERPLVEILKDLELYLTFSTEFAGKNDFSRRESIGYPGVRFTMQVDMSKITTVEDAIEKIGNICDG